MVSLFPRSQHHPMFTIFLFSHSGAFVEIGNLPATASIHEDTSTSILVYSVSVYPTSTGACGFSSGNDDGNFIITDIANGKCAKRHEFSIEHYEITCVQRFRPSYSMLSMLEFFTCDKLDRIVKKRNKINILKYFLIEIWQGCIGVLTDFEKKNEK